MAIVLTASVILALLAIVYAMWNFDRLVRWEYEHHRGEWERDGKPDGYFWKAEECKIWASDMAKKRLGVYWLIATPEWAANSLECRRWLVRMRVVAFAFILSAVVVLVQLGFKVVR